MNFDSIRVPRFALLATSLAIALGLGGCSGTPKLSAPLSGSPKSTPDTRNVPVSCPNMIPNTLETAVEFIPVSGLVASFTARRIRFEMFGDLPSPSIEAMGACVTSATPTIRFTSGHANVFLHGTSTSITETGQPVTFGELLPPVALEPGVLLAIAPAGHVLEIIWPAIAGVGVGPPIVRVQLARWNPSLISTANTYDVVWDMVAERDGVKMYLKGRADHLGLGGSSVAQVGAGAPVPCPQTLAATSDTVITQLAHVAQFRSVDLRLEIVGDVPTGTMEASGACAASNVATIQFTGGVANVFRAGTNQSVTFAGQQLSFGPLQFPTLVLEPGVVLAQDAALNLLEIIWPGLTGLGVGPPILRLQLSRWDPWVAPGKQVDVMMSFDALGPDGSTASYLVLAHAVDVPAMK